MNRDCEMCGGRFLCPTCQEAFYDEGNSFTDPTPPLAPPPEPIRKQGKIFIGSGEDVFMENYGEAFI